MSLKFIEIFRYCIISLLITTLTACTGASLLENRLSPNPELSENADQTNSPSLQIPENFPSVIPQYPQATLQRISEPLTETQGEVLWSSSDSIQIISDFYQGAFEEQSWEITQPFESENNTLIAQKDDLEVKLSFLSSNEETTDYWLNYRQIDAVQTSSNQEATPSSTPSKTTKSANFSNVPDALQSYVQDVSDLAVLDQLDNQDFNATATIDRRTYAKWLVKTHNKFYENNPAKQIRLGLKTSQPAFSDVPVNDPDFPFIQGLAESGFIPSPLTPNNNTTLFRPNDPLTREDLITWKVSLDLGKGLPKASIDNIKETWGFQDTAKIEVQTLQALYADFQNGDQSNVRRVFGYTTLFQPKKPVTFAEAAATLWYFGYQGDGLSAKEVLQK